VFLDSPVKYRCAEESATDVWSPQCHWGLPITLAVSIAKEISFRHIASANPQRALSVPESGFG
jgi:hypothetical protein